MAIHKSVLVPEVMDFLSVKPGGVYIDATFGAGGHARAILQLGGKVLGLDVNPDAVVKADHHPNLKIVQGNFATLFDRAQEHGFSSVDGILFDLGVSSDELQQVAGLSFQLNAPLDMRLGPGLGVTAADLINALPERKLDELFATYGEEPFSRRLASAVVQARGREKFQETQQLVEVIRSVKGEKKGQVHPATQVFQALRIAVNDELGALKAALPQAKELLKLNARLVVISFHSGEDRIVKNYFKGSGLKVLTKKPIRPSEEELTANPRSRSAKLRAAQKL